MTIVSHLVGYMLKKNLQSTCKLQLGLGLGLGLGLELGREKTELCTCPYICGVPGES